MRLILHFSCDNAVKQIQNRAKCDETFQFCVANTITAFSQMNILSLLNAIV